MSRAALVRGLGDIGSAVAHRLVVEGYAVVMHDVAQPSTTRRKMAFADAAFDGVAWLAGIEARLAPNLERVTERLAARLLTVYLGSFSTLLDAVKPTLLIDARMRKRAVPEKQRGRGVGHR